MKTRAAARKHAMLKVSRFVAQGTPIHLTPGSSPTGRRETKLPLSVTERGSGGEVDRPSLNLMAVTRSVRAACRRRPAERAVRAARMVGGSVGLWLLMGLLLSCRASAPPVNTEMAVQTVAVQALQIDAPSELAAGQPLTIVVHSTPLTATGEILLTAQGSFGYLPQRATLAAGRAVFTLRPLHTQRAGMVQLIARSGAVAASQDLSIDPGPAVDPLLPLIGPRSIVADGKDWTMAVLAPRDEFDNPVAAGTTVIIRAQHPILPGAEPATGLAIVRTQTQHLLAWAPIASRTRAGRMLIAASAGSSHSPERFVMEVPGQPQPFIIQADQLTVPADGRQVVRLESEPITDRYGNQLFDGTHVTILAAMAAGEVRTLPALTIDGRVYATLQAPSQPGPMYVRAWIDGVSSNLLQLDFTPGPAVQPIKVVTQMTSEGVVITAGPLVGQLDQFIPDGAAVTFIVTAPDGTARQAMAPADYGYAQIMVRALTLQPGIYQVKVTAGTGTGTASFTTQVLTAQ